MKIWLKLMAGIALGVVAAAAVRRLGIEQQLLSGAAEISIRIGRFLVFPLVFFGLVIGTYELKTHGGFWRVYARIIVYLVLSTAALTLVGVLSVTLISPDRIPIIIEEATGYQVPDLHATLSAVLPFNLFQVFSGSGGALLPVGVVAILLGRSLGFERATTRPVADFFDSFSRTLYYMNSLVTELLWVAVPILVAWTLTALSSVDFNLYRQLIVILIIDVVAVYVVILPALLYLMGETENPFKWLYASLAPAITGLVTGDSYVSLSMLVRHGNESLGLPRMLGSSAYFVFALFGRAGTAMVSAVSFILILKSYSSFEITLMQILWVALFSFLTSFVLATVPGLGTVVCLALMCGLYGRGLQEGYLILNPVAPLLISFGVCIDATVSAFVSLIIGKQERMFREVPTREFV